MELKQSIFLKGSRRISLLPDDRLTVELRGDGAISEFPVPLATLDDSPVRTKQPPSKFILGAVVCTFLLAGSFITHFFATDQELHIVLGVLNFLLLLPFGFSIYRLWRYTYDLTAFTNRFSGQIAFTLFTDRPDPGRFREFVSTLTKRIKEAHARDPSRQSESVAGQLQDFARLKEQGILTEEEFQTIKTRLLNTINSDPPSIGFKP